MLRLPTHQLGCVAQAALASAPTLSLLQAVAFGLDKHLEARQVLAAQEAEVALAVRLFGYATHACLKSWRVSFQGSAEGVDAAKFRLKQAMAVS